MKIFLDTIGCRLNQAEIEHIAGQFRSAGHEIVGSAAEADLAVVNTCTVTAGAASDSRGAIRRIHRQGVVSIVATGCWATMEPGTAAGLPGVTRVIPNPEKDGMVSDLLRLPHEFFDLEPIARQPLPGLHQRTRAFIKVQDGCNNTCSYCITTLARGQSRSRLFEQVLGDVKAALEGGTQEIVLTGVHLGAWGADLAPRRHLSDLVSRLLDTLAIPRLRLSSLEPWDLEAHFFELWQHPALCPHLHLPLQSGSAAVLKRMDRKISPGAFEKLLSDARAAIPGIALTTDIIVGFPGESEEEFKESLEFVRCMGFSGGHVFPYSARPGTKAASLSGRIHGKISRDRSQKMRGVLAVSSHDYQKQFLGRNMVVLWESTSQFSDLGWRLEGLTSNYLRVSALAPEPHPNRLEMVRINSLESGILMGDILPEVEIQPPPHS
jgi:threonylcarbamoyladenosine tRNA methylthiotransferase MtaB